MERLTKRVPEGGYELTEEGLTFGELIDAVGNFEDEIASGQYLRLPVPLGQKVYEKDGSEWIMQPLYTAVGIGPDAGRLSTFSDEAIGSTVFLAKDGNKEA